MSYRNRELSYQKRQSKRYLRISCDSRGVWKKLEEGRKLGPNLRSPSWACKISSYGLLLVLRMLHNKNYMDSPAHILASTFQPNPRSQSLKNKKSN